MRPVEVDTRQLESLAGAALRAATRLEAVTAFLAVVARVCPDVGAVPVLLQRATVIDRLQRLVRLVALAAHIYGSVESEVATSFAAPFSTPLGVDPVAAMLREGTAPAISDPPLVALLEGLPPDELEALLTASPALAAVVVASSAAVPAGSDAAALARMLGPRGTPSTVSPDFLATQRRVSTFLSGLGRRRLLTLALLHPQLVAAARAAPPIARFAASRVLVASDLHGLLTRIGAAPAGPARSRLGAAIAQRREWLDGDVTLRSTDGSVRRRRHQLLWFDPRGDGQVVEVLGDLSQAEHLAVFVPGTGSDLQRYPGTLARMVPFAAADPGLAVVVWQGADFPDQPFDDGVVSAREHVLAAAYRDAADVAGPALAADVAALRLSAPSAAGDVAVLGHSYGGSIVGAALHHGLPADRVVHIASAGAYARDAPPSSVQVYSMTAYDDPIRLSQGHDLTDASTRLAAMSPRAFRWPAAALGVALGAAADDPQQVGHGDDPDLLPGVVRLDTGRYDDSCRLVRGHSGMFVPGTTAWRNLLATMTGGSVEVLEPQRWSSHLHPWSIDVGAGGLRFTPPSYVVDRTPWSDPGYRPPHERVP